MSDIPYSPLKGTETVLDEPGHYIGWFANFCPGSPYYAFVAPLDWEVTSCIMDSNVGTHGGCPNCAMAKIDMEYSGYVVCPTPIITFVHVESITGDGTKVGDVMNLTAQVLIGLGETISRYEWKINGVIAGSVESSMAYFIEAGSTLIEVKAQNDCGNWSNVKTVEFYGTIPPLPANITATFMSATPSTCVSPCGVSVSVTWTNTGGTSGTFPPTIKVNTVEITLPDVTLAIGASITRLFTVPPITVPGTYTICPVPN